MNLTKEVYLGGDASLWKVDFKSPLYNHILNFLHTTWRTTNQTFFPGPQPCSIERKNFPTLKKNKYVVCEKTDGERHVLVSLMFEDKKICVLVNRTQTMYLAPLNILRTMYNGTILDGELVKTFDGRWFYMVYDCLMTEGNLCTQKDLLSRLKDAEKFAVSLKKLKTDPFVVKMKTFWNLADFSKFQEETFLYGTDGIVLTPVDEPVRTGTHETMFKWKPRDQNTIDFLFQRRGKKWGLFVQEKGKLFFETELDEALEGTKDGDVIECGYQHDTKSWRPLKFRRDKTYPNNRRTFYRTLINIAEDISVDEFKKM